MKLIIVFGDVYDRSHFLNDRRKLFKNGDCYDAFGVLLEGQIENFTAPADVRKFSHLMVKDVLPYVSTRVSNQISYVRHRRGGILGSLYLTKCGKHKPSAVTGHKALLLCNNKADTFDKVRNREWKYFIEDGDSRLMQTDFDSEIHKGQVAYAINFHRGPDIPKKNEIANGWNGSYGCLTVPKSQFDKIMDSYDMNEYGMLLLYRAMKLSELDTLVGQLRFISDHESNKFKEIVEALYAH